MPDLLDLVQAWLPTTPISAFLTITLVSLTSICILHIVQARREANSTKPVSVNYHFTRKCNKTCGFCFHTEKTSYVAPEADM